MLHEVCWSWGFLNSSNGVKNKASRGKEEREFYLDYRTLYKTFIKHNFISLEQFLKLTLFEVILKIEADSEIYKERLQLLETQLNWLAPHSMMGGKYKPIELIKKETVSNCPFEEDLELLSEINDFLMN